MRSSLVVTCSLVTMAACWSSQAAQTLIAQYRFSTGKNGQPVQSAIDSGPYHLDGQVTGPLTYTNDVAAGGKPFALNATGDFDYVVVPDNPALHQNDGFTLSAFAKPTGGQNTDVTGDFIAGHIITGGDGACLISYALTFSSQSGRFVATVCNAISGNNTLHLLQSADTFALGQWYKLSMTFHTAKNGKSAKLTLRVNGKVEGNLAITGFSQIDYVNGGFQIGAANFGSGDHDFYRRNFIGDIDEVKLVGEPPE